MTKSWVLAALTVLVVTACDGAGPSRPADREPAPTEQVASLSPIPTFSSTFSPAPCESRSAERFRGRPLIVVTEPCPRETVISPVTITGEANVFEATVGMRIRDDAGTVLAEGFATATCGSGCWGDFEASLEFTVDDVQRAFIEVFESSAEDGSDQNVVVVPVLLSPN